MDMIGVFFGDIFGPFEPFGMFFLGQNDNYVPLGA